MSTREKILKEAGRLFYSKGVHAVGTEAICKAAGITKPTLYHHFSNKDDLITAYIEDSHNYITRKHRETISQTEGTIENKLHALFDYLKVRSTKPYWNGCAFQRLSSDLIAQKDHPAFTISEKHKKEWEDWLTGLLEEHKIPSPASTTRMISAVIEGSITLATIHDSTVYFDDAKLAITRILHCTKQSADK